MPGGVADRSGRVAEQEAVVSYWAQLNQNMALEQAQ